MVYPGLAVGRRRRLDCATEALANRAIRHILLRLFRVRCAIRLPSDWLDSVVALWLGYSGDRDGCRSSVPQICISLRMIRSDLTRRWSRRESFGSRRLVMLADRSVHARGSALSR
jgi:hypothetical protein